MTTSQLYFSIHSLYERDNEFPSIEKINKETGVKTEVIKTALQFYLNKGKLNQVNGIYKFPGHSKKQNIMNMILRIIMGIVGFGCVMTSIKFTYSFNKLTMPKFWAFVLSSSLIIFTSFCFTVREVLKKTNKRQSNLFVVFYLIGILYSVFTAIAGQYNDYLINNQITVDNQIEEITNLKKYELLQERKQRLITQIESYKEQKTSQQKIIDDLSQSPEKKFEYRNTWNNSLKVISNCDDNINKLESQIIEIDEQLINSIKTSERKTETIFDWVSRMFNISGDLLQFLISLFPAIFIDLVSPFAISFAFNKNN